MRSLLLLSQLFWLSCGDWIPTPHVHVSMICQNKSLDESHFDLVEMMEDYYSHVLPEAFGVRLDVDDHVENCIASDVWELEWQSDGFVDLDANVANSTTERLKEVVSNHNLKEYFEDLCDTVMEFDSSVRDANSTVSKRTTWKQRLCGWGGDTGLSSAALIAMSIGFGLFICILLICLCQCCRRR